MKKLLGLMALKQTNTTKHMREKNTSVTFTCKYKFSSCAAMAEQTCCCGTKRQKTRKE